MWRTIPAVAVATVALSACGGAPAIHKHPAAPVIISSLRACQKLRADIVANGGTPDRPVLAYIASHTSDAQLASDASGTIPDLRKQADVQSFLMGIDLASLAADCRPAGVQIPVPGLSG